MTVLLSTLIGAGEEEAVDNRAFKNYQDWYGYYAGGQSNTFNFDNVMFYASNFDIHIFCNGCFSSLYPIPRKMF